MTKKNYELIEHTADIGVKIRGDDLKELFKNAALALFDIIAEPRDAKIAIKNKKIQITQSAGNLDELFIGWLNELLFLSATKDVIFSDFTVNTLEKKCLSATCFAGDIKYYRIIAEIKAATYHELKIEKKLDGWQAQVIFDA